MAPRQFATTTAVVGLSIYAAKAYVVCRKVSQF